MKRKRFLAVACAAAMIASMTTGLAVNVSAADEKSDFAGEELSILVSAGWMDNRYDETIKRFEDTYDVTVDLQTIPADQYSDLLQSKLATDSCADIFWIQSNPFAIESTIVDPEKYCIDFTGASWENVMSESRKESCTYNDKLYALGAMESSVGCYYNKDILEEAGVEIPDADHPWTFSEFLDVLEKVKPVCEAKDGYALDMTFPVGEATIYYYAPFFWSNGGNLVDDTGLNVDGVFNSKENADTVNYFKTILENGYMSSVPIQNLFESGRAAFKFDGAWEVNTLYTSYPDVSFGVAPYVVGDNWNGERYTPTGSWAYAASSKTENLEGATKLVQWMSGVESGKMLWNDTKTFPSTYEAFESIDIFQTDENYSALYNQLSKYGHPRPKTPVYPQVSTSFQQVLENCVLSGEDVGNQLDKSVERINAKLKRYR